MRRLHARPGKIMIGMQRRERHKVGALRIRLVTHRCRQQIARSLQQGRMGAVGQIQVHHQSTVALNVLLQKTEDGDIRPAEAINALAGIAHHKQATGCFAAERQYNFALAGIGVLKLIYQQRIDFALPMAAQSGLC